MNANITVRESRRAAFSLIEVNMALLIVGLGLAVLLGLFPAGLRESALSAADTSQALFADQVLSMLHANAVTVTNWSDWVLTSYVPFLDGTNRLPSVADADDVAVPDANNNHVPIRLGRHIVTNYLMEGHYVEYDLRMGHHSNSNIVQAWLRVADRKATDLGRNPIYITEFIFMGM